MFWKEDDLIDVAIGKIATQSSVCKMSRENDACRAVNPCIYNQKIPYSSCTAYEFNPWWMIDLESEYKIETILVYNSSMDPEAIKSLEIYVSNDKEHWQYIEKDLFVWNSLNSIEISLSQRISARYVKFSFQGKNSLKLKKVQIFIRKYKGIIIPTRQDGFGARMIAVLNAMYLAEKTGFKFGLWWLPKKKVDKFDVLVEEEEEIFDAQFLKKYSYTYKQIDLIEPINIMDIENISNGFYGTILGYWKADILNPELTVGIQDYFKKCKENWKNIPFAKNYKEIIEYFANNNFDEYIGIHIRNGDNIFNYSYRKVIFNSMLFDRFFPLELVLELVAILFSKGKKIILFGPDIETIFKLKTTINEIYSKEFVFCANDFLKIELKNEMERIFFDLQFLANLKLIYSSNSSLYIKFAALIGKCKYTRYQEYFALDEQVNIISNSKFKINNLNKAASLAYIYFMIKDKEEYSFIFKKQLLEQAFMLDSENFVYIVEQVKLALINKDISQANSIIKYFIKKNYKEIMEILFSKLPCETKSGYERQPLAQLDLFELLQEIDRIPFWLGHILFKFYCFFNDVEKMKQMEKYSVIQKDML